MDEICKSASYKFNDQTTSDIAVSLRNKDGRQELFHCHLSVLIKTSKFFANQLSSEQPPSPSRELPKFIVVHCPGCEFNHYVQFLKLLYQSEDLVSDSLDSVKVALGVLRASLALQSELITRSCIQYLEAVPWDEKEEEEILKIAPTLGPVATPILARIQPVNLDAAKNVFISAIRFATNLDRSIPPFGDELKTSAQEQVDYMLAEDEDTPLVALDEDVKSEIKSGLAKVFAALETEITSLPSEFDRSPESAELGVLQRLSDLEWMCNLLPRMELMQEFVTNWVRISAHLLGFVEDEKYKSCFWAVKVKLVEVAGKALEAVGYGIIVTPALVRLQLLKSWLPYMRKMKLVLDSKSTADEAFPYKMDGALCENIEGAIVSLVLALPSNDQADVFGEWMKNTEQLKFPDLSEAFEVWCYRTKTAKRRLVVGASVVSEIRP